MTIKSQLIQFFGLSNPQIKHLNTPTNDVVLVATPSSKFALKLYNTASRGIREAQWELDLIEHLVVNGAPVVKPVKGTLGYVEEFEVNGTKHAAALFEWAPGEKPQPSRDTYELLGQAAARIHTAADSFHPAWMRDNYNAAVLIDEQLERMKPLLIEANQWQKMTELGERLKQHLQNPKLDKGICHMDLTLDNIHRDGDTLTVFDFDSSGFCWRALEPHGVLQFSRDYFQDWLRGYRSVRAFSEEDERAVAVFGIVGDLRIVAWKLGVAKSSRGKPLLTAKDVPKVVDGWLEWERKHITG